MADFSIINPLYLTAATLGQHPFNRTLSDMGQCEGLETKLVFSPADYLRFQISAPITEFTSYQARIKSDRFNPTIVDYQSTRFYTFDISLAAYDKQEVNLEIYASVGVASVRVNQSEPFQVTSEPRCLENTCLLEYWGTGLSHGIYYGTSSGQLLKHMLRLPAAVNVDVPNVERTASTDSDGTERTCFTRLDRKIELQVGYVATWWHEKINAILHSNELYVDGGRVTYDTDFQRGAQYGNLPVYEGDATLKVYQGQLQAQSVLSM